MLVGSDKRPSATRVLGGGIVVISVCFFVGWLAENYPHALDWQVIALLLAALGTLALAASTRQLVGSSIKTAAETEALAAATARMATETASLAAISEREVAAVAEQARAAFEQVEISRRTLQASVKPILVETIRTDYKPVTVGEEAVTVNLRNVGVGPAFTRDVLMCWYEQGQPTTNPAKYIGIPALLTVAPRDTTSLTFQFMDQGSKERLAYVRNSLKKFWVEVTYRDSTGEQVESVRLDFAWLESAGEWILADITHFPAGSEPKHEPGRAYVA